jgi:WD40 repeat protein
MLRAHTTKALTDIVFSADGRLVATSGKDADGRIWAVATGNHFALQRRSFGPLSSISLDPTGRWVAGAAPISAIMWNASSGRQLFYIRGHTGLLTSISFAPQGETVLTSSRDGTVRTYSCDICADRDVLIHAAEVRLAQTR